MTISLDIVPTTLDEAVKLLKEGLTAEDIKEIQRPTSVSSQCHFTGGMMLRNEWSLWEKDTILVRWFQGRYGITHADDISGIILECLWNDVRGEPRRDKELAEHFKKHWKEQGENNE